AELVGAAELDEGGAEVALLEEGDAALEVGLALLGGGRGRRRGRGLGGGDGGGGQEGGEGQAAGEGRHEPRSRGRWRPRLERGVDGARRLARGVGERLARGGGRWGRGLGAAGRGRQGAAVARQGRRVAGRGSGRRLA